MDLPILILITLLSFIAGFVDSIAGGGGLILLPTLVVAGLPSQVALGTNKFGSIFGTAVALYNFVRNDTLIWTIAACGLLFSFAGSFLGTKMILHFSQDEVARIIVFMLPVTAIITFLPRKQLKTRIADFSKRDLYLYTPLICLVIGFYDGFFGPGTGTFLIFGFYTFLGLHLINASAVAKVFNLASNIASCITFALADKVLYSVAIPVALANLVGGYCGSILAIRKGQGLIKIFLLLVFALLFITLIHRIWFR